MNYKRKKSVASGRSGSAGTLIADFHTLCTATLCYWSYYQSYSVQTVVPLCHLLYMHGEDRGTCCVTFGVPKPAWVIRMMYIVLHFSLLGNASEGIFVHLEV